MNKLFYIGMAIALSLGANSCNKLGSTTITGRLMQSCDTPAANREGSIITSDGLLTGAGEILFFNSDENGYFEATYSGRKSITSFRVSVQGNGDVLRVTHLEGKKKELGDVYIFPPSVSYYLYLDVDSSYTAYDTLHYLNGGFPNNGESSYLKLAGPFNNGVIDSIPVAVNMSALPLTYNSSLIPEAKLVYYINEYNPVTAKEVYFPTPHCQDEYQTVTLIID